MIACMISNFKTVSMELRDFAPSHVMLLVGLKIKSLGDKKGSTKTVFFKKGTDFRKMRLGRVVES